MNFDDQGDKSLRDFAEIVFFSAIVLAVVLLILFSLDVVKP
jgi:hypothetical protein